MESVVVYNVPHFYSGFHTVPFNWMVAVYLFLGGLGAGAFIAGVVAVYINREKYNTISRVGAYVAPLPVILGTALLIFDLDRPYRALSLFWNVHGVSAMSWGAWILMLFSVVAVIYALIHLAEAGSLSAAEPLAGLKKPIEIVGLVLAFATVVYTGVLLSLAYGSRGMFSQMIPVLFTVSAISTGVAAVMLFMSMSSARDNHGINRLGWADSILIAIEISLVGIWLLAMINGSPANRESIQLLTSGPFSMMFWIGFVLVGLIVPLVMELAHIKASKGSSGHGTGTALLASVMVLVGGMVLRYVVLIAGQTPPLT
ncbi:MAG: polysulfide reductase NrfD [Deltaproteobacteria bacterium]|nr:polysulfide reductase NrfD [Deltaproteobacteria bacterium]